MVKYKLFMPSTERDDSSNTAHNKEKHWHNLINLHNFTKVSRNLKLIKCSDFDILQFSSANLVPMITFVPVGGVMIVKILRKIV